MKKQCFICKNIKDLKKFYAHKQMPDGHINKCIECTKKYINERRMKNREADIIRKKEDYRTNHKTIWNVRYHGMKTRVNGTSISHYTSSFGKDLLSKKEFFEWCEINKKEFEYIYNKWKNSNFERKLSPSVDRLDNKKGYLKDNIRWITQQENSIKH
jgi:hypothetical protein